MAAGADVDRFDAPLLLPDDNSKEPAAPRVYAARWWVLAQYALFTCLQGWCWAIPGSLGDIYEAVYNLDSYTLQLFLNYGALFFLVVAFPVGYAMDKPGGIQAQVRLGCALVTAGAVLRLCARDAGAGSIACLHVSYVLTALAGPAAMSAVSKLSEDWFPPSERTTATAIATISNGLGTAFSSLVGPAMVTTSDMGSLQAYNWVMLALIGANLACLLAYFPPAPPSPPSASAALAKRAGEALTPGQLWGVLRAIATNRSVCVLALVYGVGGGMQAGWGGLMNLNLNNIGVSQYDAGLIGFWSSALGNLAGVAVGAYADRVRAFKALCVVGSTVGALATVWIVCALQQLLPPAWMGAALLPQLYVAFVLSYGTIMVYPLLFEMAVEATHPLPSGCVITVMTFVYNAGAAVMLFVPLGDEAAFNYSYLAVQLALLVLLVACFSESFGRFALDTGVAAQGDDDAQEVGGGVGAESDGDVR